MKHMRFYDFTLKPNLAASGLNAKFNGVFRVFCRMPRARQGPYDTGIWPLHALFIYACRVQISASWVLPFPCRGVLCKGGLHERTRHDILNLT